MCEKEHKYLNSLTNKGKWHTQAASQTSFFTRYAFLIVWVLDFTYIVRRVKNKSFSLNRDTSITMKICWYVAYFQASYRAIMKPKTMFKDLCVTHVFIFFINLIS